MKLKWSRIKVIRRFVDGTEPNRFQRFQILQFEFACIIRKTILSNIDRFDGITIGDTERSIFVISEIVLTQCERILSDFQSFQRVQSFQVEYIDRIKAFVSNLERFE